MKFIVIILIKLIKGYKYIMSPVMGNNCRFLPTCSDYTIEALQTHGFLKGIFLSSKRILSCHPWSEGGLDPVEKKIRIKK
ncbi:membrane protein insertion efficiency factor YidD [Candidatus Pelagibacter sp.]|nr:membrane protein insertion efficiency factor YidD [Candidatus Pelagibacter sp.]